jgi:hypothetical protein
MPSQMTVTKQLVRQTLLNDATLRAAVNGKVLPSHLQSAEAATVLRDKPIIIVETVGGFARYFSNLQDVKFDVWVYSKNSSDECNYVYDLAFPLLQQTRLHVDDIEMCGLARELVRPDGGWNEVVHAWYVRGQWTMKAVS